MKNFISILVIVLILGMPSAYGQLAPNFNLIVNGSFEQYNPASDRDTEYSAANYCWIRASNNRSVPGIFAGIIPVRPASPRAHSGSGYLMTHFYTPVYNLKKEVIDSSLNIRTYIQSKLLQPLKAGTRYYFTCYIGQSKSETGYMDYNWVNVSNFGAYFSADKISDFSNKGRIDVVPQINCTGIAVSKFDTFEYTRFSGSFVAKGGEQNITVGNFDYFRNFNLYFIDPSYIRGDTIPGTPCWLFVDDLSLVADTSKPVISLDHFSLGNDTSINCTEEPLILGGEDHFFHYRWNTGDTTRFISVTKPGIYWCSADYGCNSFTDTIQVTAAPFSFSLGGDTSIHCLGELLKLSAPSGYHYVWNTGDTGNHVYVTKPGIYWCRVNYGCGTYTDTIRINGLPFSFSLGADTSINCLGASLKLSAPSGYHYVWNTGDTGAYVYVTKPGIYWCRVDYGCGSYTDTIKVNALPFSFSLGTDTSMNCTGDRLRLTAATGYRYLWNTGDTLVSIDVTRPGTYWCKVDNGCTTYTDTIVILPVLSSFTLGKDTVICAAQTITLNAPAGHQYLWSTGETTGTIDITIPGTYWCSVDFGCNTAADTIILYPSTAPLSFDIPDRQLCTANLPVVISAPVSSSAYLWSNGATTASASFAALGICWLRTLNSCGDKSFTDTFTILSLAPPLNRISLGNDTSNCIFDYFLDTLTLNAPVEAGSTILWSTGSDQPSIRVFNPGIYWVSISNACYTANDTLYIRGCGDREVPKIGIPNAFTPNGDGKNDVFSIQYLPQQVVSFTLKIYNRYGQMIRELKAAGDYWDGANYEIGAYYYLLLYKDVTGKEYKQKGDVNLIR